MSIPILSCNYMESIEFRNPDSNVLGPEVITTNTKKIFKWFLNYIPCILCSYSATWYPGQFRFSCDKDMVRHNPLIDFSVAINFLWIRCRNDDIISYLVGPRRMKYYDAIIIIIIFKSGVHKFAKRKNNYLKVKRNEI